MNLIFDFDGTLVDSLPAAVEIINKYLDKYGWFVGHDHEKLTKEKIRTVGAQKLLKEFNISSWKLYLMVFMARREIAKYYEELEIFDGLAQVIKKLSKNNKLYIVTSNSNKNTKKLLKKYDLLKYFEDIDSSYSYFGKHKKLQKLALKHNLNIKETIYIGDETRDCEAARKAGIVFVGVSWGFEEASLLKKSKPSRIISSPKFLGEI